MAATDKPHRNQKTLDKVFAISCILMLASVIWMLVADYNREYKNAARLFRDVESVVNERQMLAALPDQAEVAALREDEQASSKALEDKKAEVAPEMTRITALRDMAIAKRQSIKADRDSIESIRNQERDAVDQAGLSREMRQQRKDQLAAREQQLADLNRALDGAQQDVDKLDAEYEQKVTAPVAKAQQDLDDATAARKHATDKFDRFAKTTVQKQWGLGDAFRSLPILDAFESPTKIKQIVLADLPIEYGSFKYVTRYDRCTSCHLGIDRTGFDHRTLTKLSRSVEDARDARRTAVKAAVNDIQGAVAGVLPKDDLDKLQAKLGALESAVDKGDVVTRVEARAPGAPVPPAPTPETTVGEAVKAEKDKITVKADGQETTFTVPAGAAVLIDGAPAKLENVKEGSRVVVVKGDDEDPFKVISAVVMGLRDPDNPEPVLRAINEPSVLATIEADLVRVKEEDEDYREAESLPKKLELARRILDERKKQGESLGFEPGDLPSHARTVGLTAGQVTQFAAHPRLDLFVDSNSPHPAEKFGCTICHAGQGSATDFQLAAHTPADAVERRQWEETYHWHATHDWEFPMLSSRFTESSCLKCHYEVTDLVRQGNKEEAPKLLRGFNLVRENGCFGCHEIAGIKGGREVGPDLRLEAQPPLEWLTPTDQDKAKSDPANPPGTYRKVGPSLRRIAEKTNEGWARRWIQSPRGFRPDTKMPHFYNLSNDTADGPDALPDDQKDYPAAEIHSIAHYLFLESADGLQGKDTYRKMLEARIAELQDQLQFSPLDDKERKELAEDAHKLADLGLLSRPPNAGRIDALSAALHATQDGLLERYRKLADLEQKIPRLQTRIVQLLGADLAEGGKEDDAVMTAVTDLTKQADDSATLARKYLEEITADEVKTLADLTQKRDQAFQGLVDRATPLLPKPDKELDQAKGELQNLTNELAALVQTMAQERQDLGTQAKELAEAGRTVPMAKQLFDMEGEPAGDLPAPPDKDHKAERLAAGRRIFSERGCLACHVHDAVRDKGTTGDPLPVTDEAANFAPDLSRIALKIAPQGGDAEAARRWLVQWVMNPNVYHPRTRMPITHLSVEDACAVADWLLAQKADKPDDWAGDPKTPEAHTLIALARVYLLKAPGMTVAQVDRILPPDATDLGGVKDATEELKGAALDADEQMLKGQLTTDKLERYIGKKSIGRLGCYGCHDVPGFETAKPIGTALNDWGKKDPERLAFEDADAYVRDHYNIVESRDDPAGKGRPNPDFRPAAGKEPYEQVYFEALEHPTREGFLSAKLTEPRSFDYHRERAWDDRLRMPQFRFGRSRRRPGETDDAYEARQQREEGEAREAVMTFILGLVAEPIPLKFVNAPAPDQLMEAQGRKVLEKFNCIGCHQVRPGVYDVKPSKETLAALERAYKAYEDDPNVNGAAADHVFPGHNAWTGAPQWWPDRLTVHGTQAALEADKAAGRDMLHVRLTEALRFANEDGVVREIPAGGKAIALPPEEMIDQAPTFGGAFADLLSGDYLLKADSQTFKKPDDARPVLPPPLLREGERVQPKWLYQFLLNPGTIRPQQNWMRLRMPKFNMSPDEAMELVNYFGAADQLSNPGAGLTTPYLRVEETDPKYWRDANQDYLKRLPDDKGLDERPSRPRAAGPGAMRTSLGGGGPASPRAGGSSADASSRSWRP